MCAAAAVYGTRVRRFIYLLYAVVYGYIGVSAKIIPHLEGVILYWYFVVSSLMVIAAVVVLSQRFKDADE